jgi:NADPH2:quinone reductase
LAGARVIATVRSDADRAVALAAGAHEVVRYAGHGTDELLRQLRALAREGVDHIVEVAFGSNVALDSEILRKGGSIAAYATGTAAPAIPFWPLVFKNIRIHFLGSDDFPGDAKLAAAAAINALLEAGWQGFQIGARFPLSDIAAAHEQLERGHAGRVILNLF